MTANRKSTLLELTHVLNPVYACERDRFRFVQDVTFTTLSNAREAARGRATVRFLSVQYPEDREIVPDDFELAPDLDRSVIDCSPLKICRKLPLLADIMQRAKDASRTEYIVFSNVDIAVKEDFYLAVAEILSSGCDAMTVNRRTIGNQYDSVDEIPRMLKETGSPHRGWDCFIFRKELIPRFKLGKVCVGAPPVGLLLLANLMAFADGFREFRDEYLTFHLGNERKWSRWMDETARHNKREALKQLRLLESEHGAFSTATPPGRFLAWHRNRFRAALYTAMKQIHVPARITRRFRERMVQAR